MPLALHDPLPSPSAKRRVLTACGAVVLALVSAFGLYASTGVLGDNVREVYRSAQLSIPALDALLARNHIVSVVSLRKDDPPAPEFALETAHLAELGVAHENIPMSPTRLPKPEAIASLVARFEEGPYPMLVHCEEGADRTGLAMVVWLVLYGDKSLAEARASELSIRNGHFSFGQAHAMDDFFELYGRTARGQSLREWMLRTYPSLYDGAKRPPEQDQVLARDHS
jgi:protein-tyrosine phosphatase